MEPTEEQIEKAVNFWAERLGKPKFDILTPEERQDPENKDIVFGTMLLASSSEKINVDERTRERFKEALRLAIARENDGHPAILFLDVDYHPCYILRIALSEICIDPMGSPVFPLKTRMWLHADGRVTVCDGCGVPEREL